MNTRKNRIDYALLSNPFKKPKPQYKAASVTCDKEVQQAKRLALERYINQCAKKPELNHAVIQELHRTDSNVLNLAVPDAVLTIKKFKFETPQ